MPAQTNGALVGSVSAQGCDRQMIFDMLKRLRSVVYLPNDYVCKKVTRCSGALPSVVAGLCRARGATQSGESQAWPITMASSRFTGREFRAKRPWLRLVLCKD